MADRHDDLKAFLAGSGADPRGLPTVAGFQGFFFALAAYPGLIPSNTWLPVAFGSESPSFRSETPGARVRDAVIDLYNEAFVLLEDRPGELPRGVKFFTETLANFEANAPVAQWSRGFMRGHFWIDRVAGEDALEQEFQASAFALGFFADRKEAEAFSVELGNASTFEEAAEIARAIFPTALSNYAALGREREPRIDLFEATAGVYEPEQPGSAVEPSTVPWRETPTPKTGRNEPCPCGSGKKFKKCCGRKPADAMRHSAYALRRVQDRVEAALLGYVHDEIVGSNLDAARREFWGPLLEDLDGGEDQLLVPWVLYSWEPEDDLEEDDPENADRLAVGPGASSDAELDDDSEFLDDDFAPTIAELYLEFHGRNLDPEARAFLEAAAATVNSFHEILEVEPGRRLLLRDLLLGGEHQVYEEQASRTLKLGSIIYGRVVPFDRVALLVGCGTVSLAADYAEVVEAIRELIIGRRGDIRAYDIRDLDAEIRDNYLRYREQTLHPKLPRLVNTDGEPLKFYRIRCKVKSMDDAFAALASLNPMERPEEMLQFADCDARGKLRSIEFPWVKRQRRADRDAGIQPPVLGHITLEGGMLQAEVNSAGRGRRLKRMLQRRLGESMSDLEVRVEDAETALRRQRRGDPT